MSKTLTFIGNGNMAFSIANGLKNKYTLEVVGRSQENLDKFEEKLGVNINKFLLKDFNIQDKTLILCIKPANVEEVSKLLSGQAAVIYSVLAGTSIKKLQDNFNTKALVRTMPNLAASVGASMTTLTGDQIYKNEAEILFNGIGMTRWLGSEKEIDIATALAGSGPAYLALIAESLADGAVKQGLKRDDAMAIMRGLFDGFAPLIQTVHPALLKDGVMSPGGTTAAGYAALENGNVRNACINAVEKAYKKATEL